MTREEIRLREFILPCEDGLWGDSRERAQATWERLVTLILGDSLSESGYDDDGISGRRRTRGKVGEKRDQHSAEDKKVHMVDAMASICVKSSGFWEDMTVRNGEETGTKVEIESS